jgi:hypothetical protein
MSDIVNLTQDGQVTKKILTEGKGTKPGKNDTISGKESCQNVVKMSFSIFLKNLFFYSSLRSILGGIRLKV